MCCATQPRSYRTRAVAKVQVSEAATTPAWKRIGSLASGPRPEQRSRASGDERNLLRERVRRLRLRVNHLSGQVSRLDAQVQRRDGGPLRRARVGARPGAAKEHMNQHAYTSRAIASLARRLTVLQDLWETKGPRASPGAPGRRHRRSGPAVDARSDRAWLLVGLTAAMPDQSLVHSVRRSLSHLDTERAARAPTSTAVGHPARQLSRDLRSQPATLSWTCSSPLERGGPPGDQRLHSAVVAEWSAKRDLDLVTWTPGGGALRALRPDERTRLLDLGRPPGRRHTARAMRQQVADVLPWGVPILCTPSKACNDRLAALAELTPSTVRLVGWDRAPVSSAETATDTESAEFCHYLELVKHADVVVGASTSAAAEFAGIRRRSRRPGTAGHGSSPAGSRTEPERRPGPRRDSPLTPVPGAPWSSASTTPAYAPTAPPSRRPSPVEEGSDSTCASWSSADPDGASRTS